MKLLKVTLMGLALAFCHNTNAQTPQWGFFEAESYADQIERLGQNIWISTNHGIVQVDINTGQKTVYNTFNSDLNNHRNTGIGVDSSGTLWVASVFDGLFSRTPDGAWHTITTGFADSLQVSSSPAPAVGGRVYFTGHSFFTNKPYLLIWENQQLTLHALPAGFISGFPSQFVVDKAGDLWMSMQKDEPGYGMYLLHWHANAWEVFSPAQFDASIPDGFAIRWMVPAPDGSIFLQTYTNYIQSSIKNRVYRLKDGDIQLYPMPYLSLFEDGSACTGLAVDQGSRPWVTSTDHRIWRHNSGDDWTPTPLENLGIPAGAGVTYECLFDAQNHLWMLGANTVYQSDWTQPATATPLIATDIDDYHSWGMTVGKDGKIWSSGGRSLAYYSAGHWTTVLTPWGEQYHDGPHIQADSMGNAWYLPLSTSVLTHFDGHDFFVKELTRPASFEGYATRTDLDLDRNGNLWVSTGAKELLRVKNNTIKYYNTPDESDPIIKVAIDPSGKIWGIGRNIYAVENDVLVLKHTANFLSINDAVFLGNTLVLTDWAGVVYYFNGNSITTDNSLVAFSPLTLNGLYPNLAPDGKGNLWAATYNGLFQRTPQGNWVEVSTSTSRICDNVIYTVCTDACNNVWFWSYISVVVYNPDGLNYDCSLDGIPPTDTPARTLQCWPNPASSEVNFVVETAELPLKNIHIFAEDGRCLMAVQITGQSKYSIPVQGLPVGWYTAIATDTAGKLYRVRFCVAH